MKTPAWLRILCYFLSPRYRAAWARLEQRSHVTGVAREEVVLWQGFGYRWVVSRQVINRKVQHERNIHHQ